MFPHAKLRTRDNEGMHNVFKGINPSPKEKVQTKSITQNIFEQVG